MHALNAKRRVRAYTEEMLRMSKRDPIMINVQDEFGSIVTWQSLSDNAVTAILCTNALPHYWIEAKGDYRFYPNVHILADMLALYCNYWLRTLNYDRCSCASLCKKTFRMHREPGRMPIFDTYQKAGQNLLYRCMRATRSERGAGEERSSGGRRGSRGSGRARGGRAGVRSTL